MKASVPGYLLAAVLIPAIVWPLGTIVGLSNVVLEEKSFFPTFPRSMNTYEINNGFGLPYTLMAVLGKNSLGGLLLTIYLAVTSTVSAQMIAVSSIISFDIYRNYFKPNAKNSELIKVSHLGVIFFGLFSAGFTVMLHYVGVDMTWMGYFGAMINCPGVIPLVLSILWDRQTKLAAIVSPIAGFIGGIAVWLGTAYKLYGEVTITSTGLQLPCMYGGLTALFLPGLLTVFISMLDKNYRFDWSNFVKASLIVEEDATSSSVDDEKSENLIAVDEVNSVQGPSKALRFEAGQSSSVLKDEVFSSNIKENSIFYEEDVSSNHQNSNFTTTELRTINIYTKIAAGSTVFVFLLTWVVWPLPLYRNYIFSKS